MHFGKWEVLGSFGKARTNGRGDGMTGCCARRCINLYHRVSREGRIVDKSGDAGLGAWVPPFLFLFTAPLLRLRGGVGRRCKDTREDERLGKSFQEGTRLKPRMGHG